MGSLLLLLVWARSKHCTSLYVCLRASSRCYSHLQGVKWLGVPITPPRFLSFKTQTKQLRGWKDLFQKQMFMERFRLTYKLLGEIVESGLTSVEAGARRSEEHTSELQSLRHLVC